MRTIITILILITAVNTVNAYVANIYRVDENGSIITGPVSYDIPDYDWWPTHSKVAEVGYVYVHNENYLCCFDEELNLISTFGPAGDGSGHFSIDDVRSELVTKAGAGGIVYLDLTLGFLKQPSLEGACRFFSIDENDGSLWYVDTWEDNTLYKCDHDGNPVYEFTGTFEDYISSVSTEGKFWIMTPSKVRLRNSRGWVLAECESSYFHDAFICETFFGDDSCWVLNKWHDSITKVNSSGEIVYHNSADFDRPTRLAVNQNDGSVWVTDQYNYDLVHLDSNGIELLRKDWDYHLMTVAVDPSDGTVIVVDTPRSTEITPSSLGRIKAMYK